MKTKIEYRPVSDSFVGIRIIENTVFFYYPESFNFVKGDDKLERDQIIKILKTFMVTKKSNQEDSFNSKFVENDEYPLISFLWIIKDYLSNHGYISRDKYVTINGKGRINWKKTIKQTPFIDGENYIYPFLYTEEKRSVDVLLTDVYKYCVTRAIEIIGWLFNISIDSYLKTHRYEFHKPLFLNAVKKELSHTFEDIKRIRLSHMLNILTGLDDSIINEKEITYGVDKYDVVFEKMLFSLFSNVENIKKFYPYGEWYLITDKLTKKSSNLRPDIIMVNDNERKVYILDAKYYRFGTTYSRSDLPDSSSIQKQITYSEYIKNKKKLGYGVYNAFLMPYNRFIKNPYNFTDILEFVGNARLESTEGINNEVVGILIDMNFVIENWIKRADDETEKLCEIIEEHSNEISIK